MTDPLKLPAGDELNAIVAEKIFGIEVRWETASTGFRFPVRDVDLGPKLGVQTSLLPEFSEDMSAAWQVVEKLAGPKGCSFKLYNHDGCGAEPCEVWCEFHIGGKVYEGMGGCLVDGDWESNAVTMAICRAALAAVLDNPQLFGKD